MSRKQFLGRMLRMAAPVLEAASKGELRKTMAVDQMENMGRERFTGLEAVGRLLCGMAPWLGADIHDPQERKIRDDTLGKARLAIAHQVDPNSGDFADYRTHGFPFTQFIVDTGLLALGIMRAPAALWDPLPQDAKENVLALLKAMRAVPTVPNNWILFSLEVEIAYRKLSGIRDARYDGMMGKYIRTIDSWYFGDGWYGDGPYFMMDFYNSMVIQPMLLNFCDQVPELLPEEYAPEMFLKRAQRHAEILENLVAPDGTYIATGRSLAYRCGHFHLLAQLTWQKRLSAKIPLAAAREALFAVTEKTLGDDSYRDDGFLNIGLAYEKPEIGEDYVSTGSLYYAAMAFLPLGISDKDEFWSLPAEPWTQRILWNKAHR
jgi:hypothetical protein